MTIKINNIEIEATPTEAAEFVKLFSGEVKKEPAQPKQKKAPANKKDLDVGKMKALRKAGWTLSGGRKITDWTAAVDYWAKKGTKIDKASNDLTKTMPMYQEFSHGSMQVGVDQPFEGGLVQEMLKRKRTKKNAG